MTGELNMLGWSVCLGLVYVGIAATLATQQRGMKWNAGNRDGDAKPLTGAAARADRASRNFLETFVFFAAAVLMANAMGKHTAMSALGAQIYFWTRVAYVPAYTLGIPFLRTFLWIASIVGIGMVMRAVWPGM